MARNFLLLIIIVLLLLFCTRYAVKYDKNPKCETIITGSFYSKPDFKGKNAIIVVHNKNKNIKLFGEFISKTDTGVKFNPKSTGLFMDYPERIYKFEEISCATDNEGNVVYGHLPSEYCSLMKMEMKILPLDSSDPKSLKLEIDASTTFNFCLEPGAYRIEELKFYNKNVTKEKSTILPEMTFLVKKGCINYIGDLYLDFDEFPGNDVYLMTYEIEENPRQIAGVHFGLIGSVLAAIDGLGIDADGVHVISLRKNEEINKVKELPINISLINIEHNPSLIKIEKSGNE